ncbi:MAG: sodium:solute symporter, partial [Actinomycetota bacterium]|nr:sodium:solute symporter [Actinomycetota bacterium]
TLPMVAIALYTRWFHIWGLVAGWVAGMAWGFVMLYGIPNPAADREHFGGSALPLADLSLLGWAPFGDSALQIYVGFVALVGNLVVATLVTLVLRRMGVFNGTDETEAVDYHADEGDPRLKPVAGVLQQTTST